MRDTEPSLDDSFFDIWRERLANRAPRLFRDGVPAPDLYRRQKERVLFVFREPNIPMQKRERDLRDELAGGDVTWDSLGSWWTSKVCLLAHAVHSVQEGKEWQEGWDEMKQLKARGKEKLHKILLKFGYVQLKKTGGGGSSTASIVEWYTEQDADLLRQQLIAYEPFAVIGCGVSRPHPARLLLRHVFPDDYGDAREITTKARKFFYWQARNPSIAPRYLAEFYHPSARMKHKKVYRLIWTVFAQLMDGRTGLQRGGDLPTLSP